MAACIPPLLVPAGWALPVPCQGCRCHSDFPSASARSCQAGAGLTGRHQACPNLSGEEISPGRMEQRINFRESVAPNSLYERRIAERARRLLANAGTARKRIGSCCCQLSPRSFAQEHQDHPSSLL